jgi:hypothetical protein
MATVTRPEASREPRPARTRTNQDQRIERNGVSWQTYQSLLAGACRYPR